MLACCLPTLHACMMSPFVFRTGLEHRGGAAADRAYRPSECDTAWNTCHYSATLDGHVVAGQDFASMFAPLRNQGAVNAFEPWAAFARNIFQTCAGNKKEFDLLLSWRPPQVCVLHMLQQCHGASILT